MKSYHIHTEWKRGLGKVASRYFPAFTLTKGTGYWQGTKEVSATIEVLTANPSKVNALAKEIKRVNKQMAVLVESMPVRERMV